MSDTKKPSNEDDFAAEAAAGRTGLASEFVAFLKDNKKWWLAPIIISIVLLGALVMGEVVGEAREGPLPSVGITSLIASLITR